MSQIQIGVVADTHCPERVPFSVLPVITEALAGCDCILHVGDIETQSVLESLSTVAPVYAVRGDDEIDTHHLPEKRIVEVNGLRVGMHHGHRPFLVELPNRLKAFLKLHEGPNWGGIQEWLLSGFKDDEVNIIVFGHFHMPYSNYHNGVLLFSPGSIYKLGGESLAYRIKHSRSPRRRLTARLQKSLVSANTVTPSPTVGRITINNRQIATEILTLPPVDYTSIKTPQP